MPTITTSDEVAPTVHDEGAGAPVVLIAGLCAALESRAAAILEFLG
jgi:hypothetical protein